MPKQTATIKPGDTVKYTPEFVKNAVRLASKWPELFTLGKQGETALFAMRGVVQFVTLGHFPEPMITVLWEGTTTPEKTAQSSLARVIPPRGREPLE